MDVDRDSVEGGGWVGVIRMNAFFLVTEEPTEGGKMISVIRLDCTYLWWPPIAQFEVEVCYFLYQFSPMSSQMFDGILMMMSFSFHFTVIVACIFCIFF